MTDPELTPELAERTAERADELMTRAASVVLGQDEVLEQMLVTLLAGGHALLEGVPGTAKTLAIQTLAGLLRASFSRVQFTPDLMPTDVTGVNVFNEGTRAFDFVPGPIFADLVLADEINRAPAKVQSALLEAMAERQVTVGHTTYPLPALFMVMATQNPIEQEGTYPLPEAQLDRFMLHVKIDYPDLRHEKAILRMVRGESAGEAIPSPPPLAAETVFAARRQVASLHVAEPVEDYMVRLIGASRGVNVSGDLTRWIAWGASPRGTIALDACARAHAWLDGRDFVSPDDVQAVVFDVLRHRIILSYEAEADAVDADAVIDAMLMRVAAP